jgi:hypothetical protein
MHNKIYSGFFLCLLYPTKNITDNIFITFLRIFMVRKLPILLLTLTALVHLPLASMDMRHRRTQKKEDKKPALLFNGEKVILLDGSCSTSHSGAENSSGDECEAGVPSAKRDCTQTTVLVGPMAALAMREIHQQPHARPSAPGPDDKSPVSPSDDQKGFQPSLPTLIGERPLNLKAPHTHYTSFAALHQAINPCFTKFEARPSYPTTAARVSHKDTAPVVLVDYDSNEEAAEGSVTIPTKKMVTKFEARTGREQKK